MPPGGGGGGCGERGCTALDHTPALVRGDGDAPPHSTPPLPAIVPVDPEEEKQHQPTVANLPEGPLVEILARVPYRSLCRFKCVSKAWLVLCSSRDIRKRSPQTLSGFFYYPANGLSFRNLSGRGLPLVDPYFPFLRESYERIYVKQICNGLLVCICLKPCSMGHKKDVVVCNPATEEWTVLPPIVLSTQTQESSNQLLDFARICLGFDAAFPSRFVVFVPMAYCGTDSGKVAIYSSESGQWNYVHNKWASGITLIDHSRRIRVFLHGTMHLTTLHESILTVDTEGKVWGEIRLPDDSLSCTDNVCLGQSQGLLYAWQIDNLHGCQLSIWVIEDYGTKKWTLKHYVNVLELFGRRYCEDGNSYSMFAIHPDRNVIFLTDMEKMAVSYGLDNQEVCIICTEFMYGLPYVPCFAELPSAGH
uniref:Uncharacterized protein n=1 Tax=Avena sativa TaxID=4498 RepID=A0ACD5TZE2_AVESA